MNQTVKTKPSSNLFSRGTFLRLLDAGIAASRFRFVREASLSWLSNYPGDLQVGLYYAQSLLGENRARQALPILHGLCGADPEFIGAAESFLKAYELVFSDTVPPPIIISHKDINAYLFALTGRAPENGEIASWGHDLRSALRSLVGGDPQAAEDSIRRLVGANLPTPLAGLLHLRYLAANDKYHPEIKRRFAEQYRQRWPDCLAFALYLADWNIEGSESHQAVALLHQVVARDVAGQVARRLWGERHKYRHLWPENLELEFQIPIPAEISSILGWNRLPNPILSESATQLISEEDLQDYIDRYGLVKENETVSKPGRISFTTGFEGLDDPSASIVSSEAQDDLLPESGTLFEVQKELEKLADHLELEGLSRLDGRFPIYVVLSVRKQLQAVYGSEVTEILVREMNRLVQVLQNQRGWGARLFLADDPDNIGELGIKPAHPCDAWELKLALSDLDGELEKRGEMIGALLIVGGPEIVPYHRLPNPLDDLDVDVPSDNPYTTRDGNYFVSEWPVGRLPGGCGRDARLLIKGIRKIAAHHQKDEKPVSWMEKFWCWLSDLIDFRGKRERMSFGYTAAIWKNAAESVFSTIGDPAKLHVSPPCGRSTSSVQDYLDDLDFDGTDAELIPEIEGTLAYFNLHGVVNSADWFGHRDPHEPGDGPEYPIALQPGDIPTSSKARKGNFPLVVFSEACYGAHIENKTSEEAIALKFLEAGSLAVVGSTSMSYGSLGGRLSAADLLAQSFWSYLQEGLPAGEALRQAKMFFIHEMDERQGFLDGEDQKTLLSFNLFGDPLALPFMSKRYKRTIYRQSQPLDDVNIVCDRLASPEAVQEVPEAVLRHVRQVVSQYLPGMVGAHVAFVEERQTCTGQSHTCPASQMQKNPTQSDMGLNPGTDRSGAKSPRQVGPKHKLVTLSKHFQNSHTTHSYFAHLRLNEAGELVKLVVSR